PAAASQVLDVLARPEAEPRAVALDHRQRLPLTGLQPADDVDPFDVGETTANLVARGVLALARQQVDVGGAAGRADRELGGLGALLGGCEDRPFSAEQLGERQPAVDRSLRV